jgi:DNA polymerase (family 10)
MALTNEQIAELFENMGSLLEMKGDTVFKIRAYQRAARTIGQLSSPLATAVENGEDLTKIPGVGKAISEKIAEYISTGQVSAYERLVEELPSGVLDLKEIPGVGPKMAMAISQQLGISTVDGVANRRSAARS